MENVKLLPNGVNSFEDLIAENKYYVDRTMYLDRLERAGNFLIMLRPRRFGKSLFLNMMHNYYDIEQADRFDELFTGLYVHDHPTQWRGKFQVLRFDFSNVTGNGDELKASFEEYCQQEIRNFAIKYKAYYGDDFIDEVNRYQRTAAMLNAVRIQAQQRRHRLYLILDEYDNFTNTVLSVEGHAGTYHDITHAEGFYRGVFKVFKPMFTRILMMGVSPVTLDDLTSGFNIATNISMDRDFNMMLGLSEDDVRTMVDYYQQAGMLPQGRQAQDDILGDLRPWYDGYCFSPHSLESDPKMYNTDMVLYYMDKMIRNGTPPPDMVDPNTRSDYAKVWRLMRLDRKSEGSDEGDRTRGTIMRVATQGYTTGDVRQGFPAHEMTYTLNFRSVLFYNGLLTFSDRALRRLAIPNNNVRRQFYEYALRYYQEVARIDLEPLEDAFAQAAVDGQWRPALEFIARAYHDTTSVRQLIEGERNVQGFFAAYLALCPYYLLCPELELEHGYCDFFLLPDIERRPEVAHSYIVEVKYLKAGASDAEAAAQWAEAVEQLARYRAAPRVRLLQRDTTLHGIVLQIRGYDTIALEEVNSYSNELVGS